MNPPNRSKVKAVSKPASTARARSRVAPASGLTHFDGAGQAHMVDVGAKAETHRVARASGLINMRPATLRLITGGNAKKGDVLGIARIAAIQGAKRTSDWIPRSRIRIEVTAETIGKTGVEMEALCAASAGLLTIYDMCKAVDRGMVISEVMLMEKRGGKSGVYLRT